MVRKCYIDLVPMPGQLEKIRFYDENDEIIQDDLILKLVKLTKENQNLNLEIGVWDK